METSSNYNLPADADRWRGRALVVGGAALVLCALIAFFGGTLTHGPETGGEAAGAHASTGFLAQFFRSYLVGFMFVVGIAVGSLAILMLQHLTGGAWGLVIRRILEASTRTLPLLAVMFIPVALGIHSLYEWSHADVVAADSILRHKSPYLNIPFFLVRAAFYFAAWFALAYFLNKWSLDQDHTGDPRVRRRLQTISAPGLVLFGLTVTFAAVDWGMSLEPHWFSTIYGLLVMAAWGLTAMAFTITALVMLSKREPMSHVYAPSHFHDLGKLLLAFVMIYAYFAFSQFLIIWSANLPEEISWYLRRLRGGWQLIGLAVVVLHFALPFALLLSRDLKRNARRLVLVALLVLVARGIDWVYLIAPASYHGEGGDHPEVQLLIDFVTMFAAIIGLGGIWLWYFLRQLRQRPLLPVGSPDLDNALAVAASHH
ncbi:MAG TPA: hypothetical protein VM943_07370 [Pyrinomonadaceae bacterium]|nr:hypothetical protein [Pyrinomonadaceae bacterium]